MPHGAGFLATAIGATAGINSRFKSFGDSLVSKARGPKPKAPADKQRRRRRRRRRTQAVSRPGGG